MELHHQNPYWRHRWFIVVFVLLVTATTVVLSATTQPKYLTSLSISVTRVNRQPTPDYQYDGYYAIQATDLFTQTLLSWFLTPSVLLEFYTKAHLDPHIDSLGSLIGRFHARKYSAQNLVVQFTEVDRPSAEKLASAISAVVKDQGSSLDTNNAESSTFGIVPARPVIVQTRPNVLLDGLAAFFGSLLLASVVLGTFRYLKE